jgi:hypothetical protein
MEEERCRIFLVGHTLFTESLGQILADTENIQVVGTAVSPTQAVTAVSPTQAVTAVSQTLPHIIIVANISEQTQTNLQPLLALLPAIPIIHADMNQDYVQIITSRRVSARRTDLLAAINELSTRTGD